jgi:hypothetical protein
MVIVPCRRYQCQVCAAVILVVPRTTLPRRWYSASAIAMALALFGAARLAPSEVRRQISPFRHVGYAATTKWATLLRWSDAVRARRLFTQTRPCPASFSRRQVAERAAMALASRAPPPWDDPTPVRAFHGAAHAA